jgi:hypothetical protein
VSLTNVAREINDSHHPCNTLFNSFTPLRNKFLFLFLFLLKNKIAIGWFQNLQKVHKSSTSDLARISN